MEQLATDILFALRDAGVYGLNLETLLRDLRQERHRDLTKPELERAVRDLADKALATPFHSPLSGQRWRITALGESTLQEEGL